MVGYLVLTGIQKLEVNAGLSAKGDKDLSIEHVRCTRKTGRWLAIRS